MLKGKEWAWTITITVIIIGIVIQIIPAVSIALLTSLLSTGIGTHIIGIIIRGIIIFYLFLPQVGDYITG